MIKFPTFPKYATVIVSVPRGTPLPTAENVDFCNLLDAQPYLVAFCGDNAEAWEDAFDWYLEDASRERNNDKLLGILTISDKTFIKNEKKALCFAAPYIRQIEEPKVVYYCVEATQQ